MVLARSGDGSDFFEKNYDRIYRYVRGMVRDSDEAEDLTQEAFLRAYRERQTVKEPAAMLAWLYRIATHLTLDRLRQRMRLAARETPLDPFELDVPDLDRPSSEQGLEQEQMSECVQRFLVDIPDTYRAAILLHDSQGLTGPEIAILLGVSLPTVKIRLHRARRRLKAALEAGCSFSCDSRGVLVCEPKK